MIRSTSRENSDTPTFPIPFQLVTAEELLFDIVPAETEIEASQILSQVLEEAPVKIGKALIRYDLALDDRVECERATQLQQPSASLGHRSGSHVSQRRWPQYWQTSRPEITCVICSQASGFQNDAKAPNPHWQHVTHKPSFP
jgi:hypothetical protein